MKINRMYQGPLLIGQHYGVIYQMPHNLLRVPILETSRITPYIENGRHPSVSTDTAYEFNPLLIQHRHGIEEVGVWLPAEMGPENFWEQFVHLAELKQMLLHKLRSAPNAALEHYLGTEVVDMILKDAGL